MEEIEEKNREVKNEKLLYDFLFFLKEKGFIDDWTFDYEKEISNFLYSDILDKHSMLIHSDLLELLNHDNEIVCKILNVMLGKADA